MPYVYDVWGNPQTVNGQPSSPWGNRFLFTGREWLSDLRIYDFRNRHYQPELGRFLQPDPIGFDGGDYNLYRYCHNDPINKVDPMGLEEWLILTGIKISLGLQTAQNQEQADAADAASMAMMVTGMGEGNLGGTLSRFGKSFESASRLARKSEEAEKTIGIHGVSASEGALKGEASTASKAAVEKHFPVHNTGKEPHRTIELPKPVTEQIAKLFNKLFGREKK